MLTQKTATRQNFSCVQLPVLPTDGELQATTVCINNNTKYWATHYEQPFFDGIFQAILITPDLYHYERDLASYLAFLEGFEYAGGVVLHNNVF